MAELYDTILTVPVGGLEEEDTIIWSGTHSGSFSLASAWNLVRSHREQWPWARIIWHQVIPKSYSILGWRVFWRKLSTLDRVAVYHPEVDTTCLLCETHGETVDHLFLECSFTKEVWRSCYTALHLAYAPEDITLEMVVMGLPQLMRTSRGGILARLALLTWLFSVWEERNVRIFDIKSRQSGQVVNTIAGRVRDIWRAHRPRQDDMEGLFQAWHLRSSTEVFDPP